MRRREGRCPYNLLTRLAKSRTYVAAPRRRASNKSGNGEKAEYCVNSDSRSSSPASFRRAINVCAPLKMMRWGDGMARRPVTARRPLISAHVALVIVAK